MINLLVDIKCVTQWIFKKWIFLPSVTLLFVTVSLQYHRLGLIDSNHSHISSLSGTDIRSGTYSFTIHLFLPYCITVVVLLLLLSPYLFYSSAVKALYLILNIIIHLIFNLTLYPSWVNVAIDCRLYHYSLVTTTTFGQVRSGML